MSISHPTAENLAEASSPEEYFRIPDEAPREVNTSVLNALLVRARSVVLLLEGDGADLKMGFSIRHEDVMNALWCVDGLIEQAEAVLHHPSAERIEELEGNAAKEAEVKK